MSHERAADTAVLDDTPHESAILTGGRGSYQVVRALGRGGMGETLLVQGLGEADNDAQWVLKRLRLDTAADWKVVDLFQREASVLESLDHPGIPAYVDHLVDEDGLTVGIIQAFVPGESLAEFVGPRSLDARDVERILRQVLDILVYLHQRTPPVVHRDITPFNIMVGDQRAMLIDFGAVKASLRTSTQVTSVGTFGYMPPEQVMGQAVPASDLYALGMSLISVACGMLPEDFPLNSETGQVDLDAMLSRSGLPAHVRRTLRSMTRPGLGQRCENATAALDLLDAKDERPITDSSPAGRQVPRSPRDEPEMYRPTAKAGTSSVGMASALVALILCGAALAGFLVLSADGPPPQPPPPIPAEVLERMPPTEYPESVLDFGTAGSPGAAPLDVGGKESLVLASSTPQGAEVSHQGKVLCTTPCMTRLPHGRRELTFKYRGVVRTSAVDVGDDGLVFVRFGEDRP